MSDETVPLGQDFLSWYEQWCRPGTAPPAFQRWAGLCLLSACLQNRVQVARDARRTGTLSMYTLFIGESGIGKGEAIVRQALRLAGRRNPSINPYVGKLTSAALLSYLAGAFSRALERTSGWKPRRWGHCWVVAEELASSLRTGDMAAITLTTMTEVWGKTYYTDMTRANTVVDIPDLCLSVLAGTTETWIRDVFHASTVDSGTLARFFIIQADPDFTPNRHPTYPENYAQIEEWLKAWVTGLTNIAAGGDPIVLQWDADAREVVTEAIEDLTRRYHEDYYRPYLNRAEELIGKLAGLLSVSTWRLEIRTAPGQVIPVVRIPEYPIITVYAARRAVERYQEAFAALPRLIQVVRTTQWTRETQNVHDVIRKAGGSLPKHRLLRRAKTEHGISAVGVEHALRALMDSEEIGWGLPQANGVLLEKPCYVNRDNRFVFWDLDEDMEDTTL